MRKLSALNGNAQGTVFALVDECVSVGRAEENLITLDDDDVSRHHALLIQDGDEYRIRDLNSANGTWINGQRLAEYRLRAGDVLKIGLVELRYDVAFPGRVEAPKPVVLPRIQLPAPTVATRPPEPVLARSSNRGTWIGVTIVASIVSAGVTFLLVNRLPQQAAEIASPSAMASVPLSTTQLYRDSQGRFACEVPVGWRIDESPDATRSKVIFAWGMDEIRVIAQPAGTAPLSEQSVVQSVAQFGSVKLAGWRQLGEMRALQVELETRPPQALWVRLVRFRQGATDHTVALYVGSPSQREKLMGQFEDLLKTYRGL